VNAPHDATPVQAATLSRWPERTDAPIDAPTGHRSPLLLRRMDRRVRAHPPATPSPTTWPEHPDVVARYLRFMGSRPSDRGRDLRVRFTGSFFRAGMGWMPATAWQFDAADPIERCFAMRIRMGFVLPMLAVDTYRSGRGEMTGTLLRARVAHGTGPTFDLGELTTWLNDVIFLAPGQLFDAGVALVELDDHHFEATVTDGGLTASGVVEVDNRGAPILFSTHDRYADLPTGPVRAEWRTPVSAWARTTDGRAVPSAAEATWILPDGPLTYVRGGFDPTSHELRGRPHDHPQEMPRCG
jgi:hypothetical protein